MNWNIKRNINLSINNQPAKLTATSKKMHIKKSLNTCYYCGGKYNKYLYCSIIDNNDNNITVTCKLCYMIAHIDYFVSSKEIILLYSKMDQIDIIRKTIDNIMTNYIVPFPQNIDKNVKRPKISMLEYLSVKDVLMDNNYKIFFTDKLNNNFISCIANANINENYMFDNDSTPEQDNINVSDFEKQISILDYHPLTNNEIKLLNVQFNITDDNYILNDLDYKMNNVLYGNYMHNKTIKNKTLVWDFLMKSIFNKP
jgi:hypothetical protein